jgi:Vitamin K-dependent gamma-carboxylase
MKSSLPGAIERVLEKKVSALGLGLFRIAFGIVCAQEIAFLIYFRHLIYDQTPYLETASPIVTLSLLVWFVVAVGLIFGLFTRVCSVMNYLFWVLFVLLTPMWRDFDGGFDQLMTSSSLILIFVHSERRLSIDNLRLKLTYARHERNAAPETRSPVIYYYVLIGVSLGLLYFDAAIHKLHSEIWINGLGAWVPNTMPYYMSPLELDWFVNNRSLQTLIGYSLTVFQLFFLFLFAHRYFRIPLLISGVAFHLGILFTLNIYPFGWGMLVHYILLVPFSWWAGIAGKIKYQAPILHTYCNRNDQASLRRSIILQHYDIRNISTFHYVSDLDELPQIIQKEYADFRRFKAVSTDGQTRIYDGYDGFRAIGYYQLLLSLVGAAESVGAFFDRACARLNVFRFIPLSKHDPKFRFKMISGRKSLPSEVSPKVISAFLAIVLILQTNSTVNYGIAKWFNSGEQSIAHGRIIHELSIYLTSISHILLGITPHALYMDDHFRGYNQISALTYIDSEGQEKWVPFIAPDGRFDSPNWGRVHSMWANVAMHPPFSRPVFERLARKVTAFWAHKLGIGIQDSIFIIKTKPIRISFQWLADLRKTNLGGNWTDFGWIRWQNEQCSFQYAPSNL